MASAQDLAEQLLRRADEDAAGTKGMLPIGEVADVLVCFHAQQAVEKALKAVLAARGVEFAHRHDQRVLIGQCENAGVRLPEELAEVDLLSPYAAELRYDDDTVHAVEREAASRWATAAVQWARDLIEEAGGGQKSSAEPEAVDGG
ncbi:MAG TPA: HEPN domain-containing protein [Solirubrobacteraceae bacterium]|nr:HEPN domain-containing protein [Solirubrobacteraceae bacterium]